MRAEKLKKKLNPEIINPYLRFIELIKTDKNCHHVPQRMLYDYSLICVLEGELTFFYDKKKVVVGAGEVHLMPPLLEHREVIEIHETCRYYVLHFDMFFTPYSEDWNFENVYLVDCWRQVEHSERNAELFDRVREANKDMLLEPMKICVQRFEELLENLDAVLSFFIEEEGGVRKNVIHRLEIKAHLVKILVLVLGDNNEPNNKYYNECIKKFVGLVTEHYGDELDVESFASKCGFTINYFRRIFKEETGISPHEYIIRHRLKTARKLLENNDLSIGEITKRVGYNDPFYFSNCFKKRVGMSPSEYRARRRTHIGDTFLSEED